MRRNEECEEAEASGIRWEELRVEADLSGLTVVEEGILIYMSHMDTEAITVVVLAARAGDDLTRLTNRVISWLVPFWQLLSRRVSTNICTLSSIKRFPKKGTRDWGPKIWQPCRVQCRLLLPSL